MVIKFLIDIPDEYSCKFFSGKYQKTNLIIMKRLFNMTNWDSSEEYKEGWLTKWDSTQEKKESRVDTHRA